MWLLERDEGAYRSLLVPFRRSERGEKAVREKERERARKGECHQTLLTSTVAFEIGRRKERNEQMISLSKSAKSWRCFFSF